MGRWIALELNSVPFTGILIDISRTRAGVEPPMGTVRRCPTNIFFLNMKSSLFFSKLFLFQSPKVFEELNDIIHPNELRNTVNKSCNRFNPHGSPAKEAYQDNLPLDRVD